MAGKTTSVKVPFAKGNDGNLVAAMAAAESVAHTCPGCGDRVFVRKPTDCQPHFFHHAGSSCSQESAEHATAKLLVQAALRRGVNNAESAPRLIVECDPCGAKLQQELGIAYKDAVTEHTLKCGRRADVALVIGELAVALIEVRHTHAVDERKAADLPLPWVELSAKDILIEPRLWTPLQRRWHDREWFDPPRCNGCRQRLVGFRKVMDLISERTEQPVYSKAGAIATAPYRCAACKRAVLVYGWTRGHSFEEAYWFHNLDSNADGVETPKSLRPRAGHRDGEVNSCLYCKSVISDEELWDAQWSPFCFGRHLLCGEVYDDITDSTDAEIAYCMEKSGRFRFDRVSETTK